LQTMSSDFYNLFVSSDPVRSQPGSQKPSPTGCSSNGTTPTVFIFSDFRGDAKKLERALDSAQAMVDVATNLGNDVHLVFIQCAASTNTTEFEVAERLLSLKQSGDTARRIKGANVHFVVGPEEMLLLPSAKGVMLEYLRETEIVHVVQPPDSSRSLWIKSTPFSEAIVGKVPGVAVMEETGPRAVWIPPHSPLTDVEWSEEVNRRWKNATANPAQLKENDPDRFQFWNALALAGSLGEEVVDSSDPMSGLGSYVAAFSSRNAPFATITHRNGKTWMNGASLDNAACWNVRTWCGGFAKAVRRRASHILDRTVDIAELQYVVNVTLSSLMRHSEQDNTLQTESSPFANLTDLRGVLGPVVDGKRLSYWSAEERKVIVLLPEQYVRFVLQDFYVDAVGINSVGYEAAGGCIYLDDDAVIPLEAPDLTAPEQRDFAQTMGSRIFLASNAASREMRVLSTGSDALVGMNVRWTFAAGRDLPTLEPDDRR